jgi:Leucine-rich repeat (LRR) protein
LELLNIESNNFVGSIDLSSFWRLPKLTELSLSNNKLSVMDGAENNSSSTHPSPLAFIGLACCRITKFPSILTHASDVSILDLSCNNISGDIPNWI